MGFEVIGIQVSVSGLALTPNSLSTSNVALLVRVMSCISQEAYPISHKQNYCIHVSLFVLWYNGRGWGHWKGRPE